MYYVFLDKAQNKLIITQVLIEDENYQQLTNVKTPDGHEEFGRTLMKTFCIAYIMGCQSELGKPVNDINEFQ